MAFWRSSWLKLPSPASFMLMTPMPAARAWWMCSTTSGTLPRPGPSAMGVSMRVPLWFMRIMATSSQWKSGTLAQGGESVDGGAAGDDGFALLGFDDAVLPARGDVGPVADVLPVEEHDVEVIGVDLPAQLVDADLGIDGVFGGHLGHELIGVARECL